MAGVTSNADLNLSKVSRDVANSSYRQSTQDLAPGAGAHVEQVLGAPAEAKPTKKEGAPDA